MALRPDSDLPYIFLTQKGTGLSDVTLYATWHRRLLELGIIKKHIKGREYTGCGLHELRDRFRTRAQKSPAPDKAMFEFFMGHDVDPLRYNKAMDDVEYTALQYRLAEPWLNILSEDPAYVSVYQYQELELENQRLRRSIGLPNGKPRSATSYHSELPDRFNTNRDRVKATYD